MLQNTRDFHAYVVENNIPMNISESIKGYKVFKVPEIQEFECGAQANILVMITDDDLQAEIYLLNLLTVREGKDKTAIYDYINRLNTQYPLSTFFENEGKVNIRCTIPFNNNFNSKLILDMINYLRQTVDEEYDRLRHLC